MSCRSGGTTCSGGPPPAWPDGPCDGLTESAVSLQDWPFAVGAASGAVGGKGVGIRNYQTYFHEGSGAAVGWGIGFILAEPILLPEAPLLLYPTACVTVATARNERAGMISLVFVSPLFTQRRGRISMGMSSRRAGLERSSVSQHRPKDVAPPPRQGDQGLCVPLALGPLAPVVGSAPHMGQDRAMCGSVETLLRTRLALFALRR